MFINTSTEPGTATFKEGMEISTQCLLIPVLSLVLLLPKREDLNLNAMFINTSTEPGTATIKERMKTSTQCLLIPVLSLVLLL